MKVQVQKALGFGFGFDREKWVELSGAGGDRKRVGGYAAREKVQF